MSDDKLIKPGETKPTTGNTLKVGVGTGTIARRLQEAAAVRAKQQLEEQHENLERGKLASTMPNRITLLPDCSGSMSTRTLTKHDTSGGAYYGTGPTRIDIERKAVDEFLRNVDFNTTSVAFNAVGDDTLRTPLMSDEAACAIEAQRINALGGTPIRGQLQEALDNIPMTRAVLISDGEPTDGDPLEIARTYREAGVPIDTIFIGDSGRETMQRIAELSGGIFIEFHDVAKLADSLKYLSPKYRAMLTGMTTADAKQLLGASDVKLSGVE